MIPENQERYWQALYDVFLGGDDEEDDPRDEDS